mgnify:CR=1 FL=1
MNIINTKEKRLDEALIERFRHISPSELGHALEFGFMDNDITLLDKSKKTYIVGTAITARIPATDSTMVYKAMTYSKPGDILVIDMHGEKRHACWGEMTTLTAKRFGLAGVVVDGPNTDSAEIIENDFPVFSKGQSNLTTKIRGFRGDVNVPVCCGGTVVCPGDLILANNDGIVVIPQDFADKFIEIAELYEGYNEVDKKGFADNLPLTEIMSFDRKIAAMENVIYLGEEEEA